MHCIVFMTICVLACVCKLGEFWTVWHDFVQMTALSNRHVLCVDQRLKRSWSMCVLNIYAKYAHIYAYLCRYVHECTLCTGTCILFVCRNIRIYAYFIAWKYVWKIVDWRMKQVGACEQGNQCFKEGRYDEAIECYTQAIHLDDNYAVLYANRAMALLKQEKWVCFHFMSVSNVVTNISLETANYLGYVQSLARECSFTPVMQHRTHYDEGCDLHRLISLMFCPSACPLSTVVSFRLLVLRSGTAYQIMSPPLRRCEPSGAIWRHTYYAAVTTLSDTART